MNNDTALTVKASFSPDLANLAPGAELVHTFCRRQGIDPAIRSEIDLAVSEALTNAFKHSGAQGEDGVGLVLRLADQNLEIEVWDNGPGFNFHEVPNPDFNNHPTGGYGLYIIKNVMDQVGYHRRDDRNVLAMAKRLDG